MRKLLLLLFIVALLTGAPGCIERILTVQTNPPGALVELNGQEMGRTPVSQDFVWYGTYDLVIRKDGYETLKTSARVFAPLYEWVPFDLITELLPFHFKDHHRFTFDLTPTPPSGGPDPGIVARAEQLRHQMETTHYPATRTSK